MTGVHIPPAPRVLRNPKARTARGGPDVREVARLRQASQEVSISPVARTALPCAKPFPFDASELLLNRWHSVWSDDPVRLLHEATALLRDHLSSSKVHEIASALARLPKPDEGDADGWARVLVLEVGRALARVEGGALRPEDAGLVLDEGDSDPALHARVRGWVDRLLIARTFAQATARERRRSEEAAA